MVVAGAKFQANFAVDPANARKRSVVVETAPVDASMGTTLEVDMAAAKNLPVGADGSRDFTAVADLSPSASRDSASYHYEGHARVHQPRRHSHDDHHGYHHFDYERYEETPSTSWRGTKSTSTFSIDVDAASYTNVRRYIQDGQLPPAQAVRIEEMINYFDYAYPDPPKDGPFGVYAELGPCPWDEESRLLQIGLNASRVDDSNIPARNLVFLVDVSGSMHGSDRLPLLQQALMMLTAQLRAEDTIAIVAYAGSTGVVLPPTRGDRHSVILEAVARLQAGGGTNGAGGIREAYELARSSFRKGGVNRVILGTDGDFNVGISDPEGLEALIEGERKSGIELSVLGFGRGNLDDAALERLADHGNGNYHYIDGRGEARKVLVEEANANLVTVAKDVKLRVNFDPDWVDAYRLIGYANRQLETEDFEDDTKDAGEMGAGHSVTALYELRLSPDPNSSDAGASRKKRRRAKASRTLATIDVRYKAPGAAKSKLRHFTVPSPATAKGGIGTERFRLAAAVATFGLMLRREIPGSDRHPKDLIGILPQRAASKADERISELGNLFVTYAERWRRHWPDRRWGEDWD